MEAAKKITPPRALLLDDIWFILANYIPPEDVQRYSLICQQSAKSINTREFWFNLYNRYCHRPRHPDDYYWVLPEYLQIDHLKHCEKDELKRRVIRILYRRYPPLTQRLFTVGSLDKLIGRTYYTSWSGNHSEKRAFWFLIFTLNYPLFDPEPTVTTYPLKQLDCPFDKSESCECSQNSDGMRGLHITCDIAETHFPEHVLIDTSMVYQLAAIRVVTFEAPVETKNLELDFISCTRDRFVYAKFVNVSEYKIMPWYHPTFRVFE